MGVQNSINAAISTLAGAAYMEKSMKEHAEKEIASLQKEDDALQKEEASIPFEQKKNQVDLLNTKDEKARNKMSLMQGDIDQYTYNIANRNAKLKVESIKLQKEQLNNRLKEISERRMEISDNLKALGGK